MIIQECFRTSYDDSELYLFIEWTELHKSWIKIASGFHKSADNMFELACVNNKIEILPDDVKPII